MEYVKEVCKGLLIGIANIVPGVSGGTMAVSMGIYDKIIRAVTHFFKEPKKSILTLLPYGIGAILGIGGLSFLIEWLFGVFPFQASMVFVGLILGGLPVLVKKVKGKSTGFYGPGALTLTFLAILFLTAAGEVQTGEAEIFSGAASVLLLAAVGVISAATMVVPGVSGSMILMMLGYYQPILRTVNDFVLAAVTMDFAEAWHLGWLLFPFGAGLILGVFLCARLVEFLLSKFPAVTYFAIIGLVLSSPVAILWGLSWSEIQLHQLLIGFSLALLAYVLTGLLEGESN